jgi:hypothetical protein
MVQQLSLLRPQTLKPLFIASHPLCFLSPMVNSVLLHDLAILGMPWITGCEHEGAARGGLPGASNLWLQPFSRPCSKLNANM